MNLNNTRLFIIIIYNTNELREITVTKYLRNASGLSLAVDQNLLFCVDLI